MGVIVKMRVCTGLLLALLVAPAGATRSGLGGRHAALRSTLRARRAAVACADGGSESDALEQFRQQLLRQMASPSVPQVGGRAGTADLWATPNEQIEPGTVLLADYKMWKEGAANKAPFSQFALRGPLPSDLPADMIARVLPVVVIVSKGSDGSHEALLLERRTGILLGDIKGEEYACAPINSLWFGGTAGTEIVVILAQHDGPTAPEGMSAVFTGVSFGTWAVARPLIEAGTLTGTRSFIFAGKTVFGKGELDKQLKAGFWKSARVSRDVLFKERSEPTSRKGSKPLWREALELCEGEYARVVTDLYGDEL